MKSAALAEAKPVRTKTQLSFFSGAANVFQRLANGFAEFAGPHP